MRAKSLSDWILHENWERKHLTFDVNISQRNSFVTLRMIMLMMTAIVMIVMVTKEEIAFWWTLLKNNEQNDKKILAKKWIDGSNPKLTVVHVYSLPSFINENAC